MSVKLCFVGQATQKNLNCTLFSTGYIGGLFKGDTIFFNMEYRAGNETPPGLEVERWVPYTPSSEVQKAKA